MATFAYKTRPGSVVQYIGVAVPKGIRPAAYLIYFRHSAQPKDYPDPGKLLTLGIGDYFEGRQQVCRQVAASGKNVAVILPIAIGGSGEFENNSAFVAQCIKEIQTDLFGGVDAPLLLACYSDGIEKMSRFMQQCGNLMPKVRAVYDLDGSRVLSARSISLSGLKARVFRYEQTAITLNNGETLSAYLTRKMLANPAHVPLPHIRWISYPFYPDKPPDGEWLHYYIPTCMLHHGLAMTRDI